jgi:(S)-mandelate dehydrogenase
MLRRRVLNIEDLRQAARRRLPRILFDWVEGGAEDETGLGYVRSRLAAYRLVPRYLRDITHGSLRATLFDREFGRPFGIAPTGYTGLLRPGGERALATLAQTLNVPYVLSGVSVASIEEAASCAPGHVWFQLYPGHEISLSLDLIRRARDAGVPVLVVTADLPVASKRERDIRHGFKLPLRYSPRLILDGILHPTWTASYFLTGGLPPLGSWAAYVRAGASATEVAMFQLGQKYPTQTWADVEVYRRNWPGKLVIKGLLHPADALRAQEVGADGIIVSNHGGRQLDRAVAPIDVLPAIKAAVGSRLAVMLDGGVRRGADIAVALALGADFVFLGRAVLYGLVARGLDGAKLAMEILTDELTRTMAQVGATEISQLDREVVVGGDLR